MKKLYSVPSLRGLLLFVRATYADPTQYVWEDEAGVQHRILQAEGGEQGDPLMPLLFSLAMTHWQKHRGNVGRNTSSPFWMTCTPLLMCQTVRVHCMTAWEQSCTHKLGFAFTRGRQEYGTERHYVGCRVGTGSVEPNAFGFTEVHSGGCRQTIGGRTKAVGRNPNGAGFAGSVADPFAVRRPEVPPHVANIATITVRSVRPRT